MNSVKQHSVFFGGFSSVLHAMLVPLFAFVFVILYKPFLIVEKLQMASASWTFNITILLCIAFGTIALTRLVLFLLRGKLTFNTPFYLLWCFGELVLAALFLALYLTLMLGGAKGYFEVVGSTFTRLLGICIYPYALLYLGLALYIQRNSDPEEVYPASLIKFHDEYNKLRLVIASEAVIFIKSEENYVQIHYNDHSRSKKFVLRSSMRALEEQLTRHGLVRCHRSYFLNPAHVKMIRKESSGVVVAELNQEGFDPVPISRKYQEEITRLL